MGDALTALRAATDDESPRHLSARTAGALGQVAMAVIGDYASWIDIGLIVSLDTVQLLYGALDSPYAPLRYATADTLCEIVSKGMKPADKLSLVSGLSLDAALVPLEASSRSADETELREHLAKLVNALCTELCKIAEDTAGATDETRDAAQHLLLTYLPLALSLIHI